MTTATTPSYEQPNLMHDLLAQHPHVGRLAWFTVQDDAVDRATWIQQIMDAGLSQYGLPQPISDTTAYLRGLHALQTRVSTRTHLRRVAHRDGETIHHWIEETIAHEIVHFRPIAAIHRHTKTQRVHFQPLDTLTPDEADARDALPEAIATAADRYTASDRRRQIQHWFDQAGALHLTQAGPVQFIPEPAMGLVTALESAQAGLHLHCWSMPVPRTDAGLETLTASLEAEVTETTSRLIDRAKRLTADGKTPSVRQQAQLLEEFQALHQRIQYYTDLFGTQLDTLQTRSDFSRATVQQLFTAI
jgi:hypothetical protein